nr:DUF4038 domain-containing protein [Cytophagales bacterium]
DKESLASGYRHMIETKQNQAYAGKPFLMGEIVFEGMHGESREKVQRVAFWSAVLSGAVGHCYGADAIWQFNTRTEPFGASPTGITWGNAPWEDACQWLGATHVGVARKILLSLPYWQMEPHPEWISPGASPEDVLMPYAAGVPNEWRLLYFPKILPDWRDFRVKGLEPGLRYRASFIDPLTGNRTPIGEVTGADEKGWRVPPGPILQDWLVLLERIR